MVNPDETAVSPHPILSNQETLTRLMRMLEDTQDKDLSCDETFALLDEFTEIVADQQDAALLMPLVQHHVDACPDCREQFEVLLNILQTETAV